MQRYLHATCLKIVYKGTESAKMILFTIAAWAKQLQIDIYNYRSHLRHSKDIRATDNRKSYLWRGIVRKFTRHTICGPQMRPEPRDDVSQSQHRLLSPAANGSTEQQTSVTPSNHNQLSCQTTSVIKCSNFSLWPFN